VSRQSGAAMALWQKIKLLNRNHFTESREPQRCCLHDHTRALHLKAGPRGYARSRNPLLLKEAWHLPFSSLRHSFAPVMNTFAKIAVD